VSQRRVRWSPRRVGILALAGLLARVTALVIGGPSDTQTTVCNLGGRPCSEVYARGVILMVGILGAFIALVAGPIATARALKLVRAHMQRLSNL
jgi:hypothetical protein